LDELCRKCREHRAAIGTSHIIRLITVPARRRAALERAMVREGWSVDALDAEIARRYGQRRHGGRRHRPPADVEAACVRLDALTTSWLRWVALMDDSAGEGEAARVTLDDLPAPLPAAVGAARRAMERLQEAAVAALQALRPGRRARPLRREQTRQ
jgi:hypothetical protein